MFLHADTRLPDDTVGMILQTAAEGFQWGRFDVEFDYPSPIFPLIALMEDIAISARLKKLGRPCCLRAKVITSARRWRQYGIAKTILLMWRLRLACFFGADPEQLAARYYRRY